MSKIKMLLLLIACCGLMFAFAGCEEKPLVRFFDGAGNIIKEERVKKNRSATAPDPPVCGGSEFIGWDKEFNAVTEDIDVKPVFYGVFLAKTLKPDFSHEGRDFISDGKGEVELVRVIDGDTLIARTNSSDSFTVRFLGVNTPESTGDILPWGKPASSYAKERLENAESVLLEAEGERRDNTSGRRWLAWVWYKMPGDAEYRLFNLEEVELGYSKYTYVQSKYFDIMKEADEKAKKSGKKLWGEKDPDYNYAYYSDKDEERIVSTTLLNIYHNHDKYKTGTVFCVKVRLVRTIGNSAYVEDAETQTLELNDGETLVTGKGAFYIFWGYKVPFYREYEIGDVFQLECQLEWQGDFGTQLTGPKNQKSPKPKEHMMPVIPEIDADSVSCVGGESTLKENEGRVITLKGIECVNVTQKDDGEGKTSYTAYMKNDNGVSIDVHFHKGLIVQWDAEKILVPGRKYDITGGVGYYQYANGKYQLLVGDAPKINNGKTDDLIRPYDIKEVN